MTNSYEQRRLERLAQTHLLDSLPEQEFNDIVQLCTQACDVPIALISLVDNNRQWFKACVGLGGVQETPREIAFCDHTVRLRETLVVPDATADSRFMNNPLVVGEPRVRFYAGAPLLTADGYCLGTLCIVDMKTRELTHAQRDSLEALARQVMTLIEKRTLVAESQLDQLQAKDALHRLDDVTAVMEAGALSIDKTGRCTYVNDAWTRITGMDREESLGYAFLSRVLEEDRIQYFPELLKARVEKVDYKQTVRMRMPDERIRHIEFHSKPDRNGGRVGTAYDVTEYVERIRDLEKELIELRTAMLKKSE